MKETIGGQPNIRGINAQIQASMSLFLQFLRDPRFLQIYLEPAGFQDFNLVFNDGHKIICESKNWKEIFNYAHLRSVLQNISDNKIVGDNDEILIICNNVSDNLKSDIEYVKYFEYLKNKFKQKGYSDTAIVLLPRVKFWIVPSSFNEKIIYSLFANLINFWIPSDDVERIVDRILIQKIYKGSAKGGTYSKTDILKEIDDLVSEVKHNSIYYNNLEKREKQFKVLDKALKNPNHKTWTIDKELSAFSTDYERLKFVKDRLEGENNKLILKNWIPVWKLNRIYSFNFGIFRIFENNLHTEQNKKYVLSYIKDYTKTIHGFYHSDFFDIDVVKIVTKIIEGDDGAKYLNDAFAIVEDLITFNEKDFFFLKDSDHVYGQWEKEEICKLMQKIYRHGGSNALLKRRIFNLLVKSFNITEDEGRFSNHASKEVYEILREWLDEDFIGRFEKLVKVISDQYERFYQKFGKKIHFDGWERMGGGISFSGGYHIDERHFVGILAPAINNYYAKNPTEGWKFIKDNCLSKTDDKTRNKVLRKKVDPSRPDFLNRAVYKTVLDRYAEPDKGISNEAFEILKEFILSKRGIPHKTDLIYYDIVNSNLSDDKKWELVNLTIKEYGIPVNPFAEHVVTNLAKKGHEAAKNTLRNWFKNKKYHTQHMIEAEAVSNIRAFLDVDIDFAIGLFIDRITSDFMKSNESNHFSAYSDADLLNEILRKDYKKGLLLIRILEKEEILSENQQIVYCFGLFNNHGNDDSDDVELLMKIYGEVIDPFLKKYDDNINKIYRRLPVANCREAFVQFATRLAVKKKIAESLRIVRVFVNDPDPYFPGEDPRASKNEYNEHKMIMDGKEPSSITSVRGWCGWVLMKCSVLSGRDYIGELIDLTEKLTKDSNWYVKHMACFALSQLAQNRLTVLPDNREILFFGKDTKEALERAKRVEKIAFDLLEDIANASDNVKKALAKSILTAFDHIRTLNEKDALIFVNIIKKFPDEAIAEAAPLFIFFAEFRKDAFKNWKWSMSGLYDDLMPDKYDDGKFKKILMEVINRIKPKQRFSFVAEFEHMTRDLDYKQKNADKLFNIAYYYLDYLSEEYNHDVFKAIYMTIKNGMIKKNYFDEWYNLFLKCLKTEKNFYDKNFEQNKSTDMYWLPSFYNSEILELINEEAGKEKFIEAAQIIFSFPKQLEIHESDKIISILKEFPKSDKRVKKIFNYLVDKNPSKYWGLK